MATPNRFAIRDVGRCTFFRLDGDFGAIATLDSLKTSGVETSAETVYARGGVGNAKIVGFSSGRESKLNLEDALFTTDTLAMITGNEIQRQAKKVDYQEILVVDSKHQVMLSKGIVDVLPITIATLYEDGTLKERFTYAETATKGTYSFSGQTVTFSEDIKEGVKVKVFYTTETAPDAKTIRVTTDSFGKTFRVVLDVLVRDAHTKKDYAAQIRIPCAKFEDNFSFSFAADGDPATLTLPLEILKDPNSNDMWEMTIYDAEDLAVEVSVASKCRADKVLCK